ncbi:hypothetical protein SAMN06265379_101211 [Saccharicrinis carchari]|uniref:Uncharacterized protein n=1 Tax=Saccharicrinis carchari TaxID=1168039 RepID=A0A521AKX8_SACCC|nr:glycosyltransferase family 4 protein [Saccharicrinis carchari]SMO35310.1 hypothetical protein SAMN06265379_101211 [Saccharicrinis carchari]
MPNKQLFYFTFNDLPGGVYNSQVIEVVNYLNGLNPATKVRLLSIISPRGFLKNRKQIKALIPNAVVLPTLAPLKYWRVNILWLFVIRLFSGFSKIICRGPVATCLSIDAFKDSTVIYDGRGAVVAEQEEYGVYDGSGIEHKLYSIEQKAVLKSDWCIAVTEQLVQHWQDRFAYRGTQHSVIPCTVSSAKTDKSESIPSSIANFIQCMHNKTIFTFAGGNGKWQGIDLLITFLEEEVKRNDNSAALLLTPLNSELEKLQKKYPHRVHIETVSPEQVHTIISQCDYGLLLRYPTLTNRVASPVKVAEYLRAGLKVIISPNIGDYSKLIANTKTGYIWEEGMQLSLSKIMDADREQSRMIVEKYLAKESEDIAEKYMQIIRSVGH